MGEGESRVEPLLLIEGLHRSFGSVVVADDLTFSLSAGETLGVVGPNGAGKTSMLNLITGSLAPRAGRIRLDGVDITGLPVHRRAALGVARTYQIPRPFETMTVFENVLVGAVHAAGDRLAGDEPIDVAVEALERTDLLRRANVVAGSLPLLDRKRLELARALATRPRLLLLDEIAGGLTEPEVDELVGTIRRLKAEGLTILWIEHIVQALLSVVDRLMATSYGRKLAEGEPRVVLADPTVRAVYLGNEPAA